MVENLPKSSKVVVTWRYIRDALGQDQSLQRRTIRKRKSIRKEQSKLSSVVDHRHLRLPKKDNDVYLKCYSLILAFYLTASGNFFYKTAVK